MSWGSTNILFTISAICTFVFLLYLPIRLGRLRSSNTKTASNWQGRLIATLGVLLSIVLSIYLTGYLTRVVQYDTSFVASLVTSLVAALGLSLLSLLEQQRSFKPSDLATLYLVSSVLCDVLLLTMPSKIARHADVYIDMSHIIVVRSSIHLVILILECSVKRLASDDSQSPEELNGVLSRVFFTWINPILLQGHQNILIDQDLPPLSCNIRPAGTRKAIIQTWHQRVKPETKMTLPLALLKCVKQPFLAAITPRLFLILFRYSQPVLIKQSIRFVTKPPDIEESNYGYWIVVAAVAIYLGLAVSTSVYQHKLNRLKLVIKSALVGLIHDKTIKSPSIAYDNGESITLMSTDADSLNGIGEMFHETWAQVLEVVIGISLLAYEVGWIWPLPLFLIYLCSHVSRFVAKCLRPQQKAWNKATQRRVAATSSLIGSMKIVKMLGFQHYLTNRIEELREMELYAASKLRWVMVYYNASANALGIFTPAITLVIFAVISRAHGRKLDAETAFTTVAILSMVTHPANMVMTIVPRVVACFAGFERIQAFMLQPWLHDFRGAAPKSTLGNASGQSSTSDRAIVIQQLKFGENQPILEKVNMEVASGSIVIISGPVGSGKSTLLRAILGEVVPKYGMIRLSTQRIAYCSQKPRLPSGSINEVIRGSTCEFDGKWYHEVLEMCCLDHDLNSIALPDGDATQIGSRGLNLSGGQKQRVALARALFARCEIILLDDTFSGLDGGTEKTVFNNLFGPRGLFRRMKCTVVLVSNSTQYFHVAHQLVILGVHGVTEQGTWDAIKVKAASIEKFISSPQGKNNAVSSKNLDSLNAQFRVKDEATVDLSRQTGDFALYGYYFRFVGWTSLFLLFSFTVSTSFFITIPQYWIQLWTQSSIRDSTSYICGFLFLAAMSWTCTNGIMWSNVIRIAPQSGMRLHQRLLHIVTKFSQDIQLIDKELPTAVQTVGVQMSKLFMQAVLLLIAQKWLALSLPACMLVVYIVQKIYLRTSRQLRFLELESRAAVFSSFLESIEGLEIIRAFGWTLEVIDENISCVEDSQRAEFLLLSLQRWLNLVLDLLSGTIATCVVAAAVIFRGQINGGQVGIALNIMLVANTTLLKLVESWTTLEISLGAVSRLRTLEMMTPSEGMKGGNIEPPRDWPSKGRIEFKNVTASYNVGSVAVQHFSLSINEGQKVIICGRTGSGKSTLLLTLLRILELQSGSIVLDGIDISQVRLDILRERSFITVSQDPLLLFNESLRFNLDPDNALPDDVLINALAKTGLWTHFYGTGTDVNEDWQVERSNATNLSTFGAHPILDKKISIFHELSGGQYQLFALSRALVKTNRVRSVGIKPSVLLDEVTSSLDSETEATIYRIIDEEFTDKGHTVIIVTHRIGLLADQVRSGRKMMVMMSDGRLQEIVHDLRPGMLYI